MLHKRFTMISFVLGLLLVMHGLIVCSFAHTHHQDSKDGITLNGGRKVLIKKLEIAKVGGANDARGISEIISGATSTRDNGNTNEGKKDFDGILCRLEDDAKNIMDSSTKGYKKVEAGFVAFNSDYHGPQHHPPKHN